MKELDLYSIAKAMEGQCFFDEEYNDKCIEGAVIDSRKVLKNYLFFAVKGERVDGHDFVEQVFEKGALAVVSEKKLDIDKPYILVDSTLEALKKLAKYYRSKLSIPIVGISGSVGKTSTKEFVSSVLSVKYNVLKTEGNLNNEIGVPLTIMSIKPEHEVAVVEMGISDFGEMSRLSQMAAPDICILTNVGYCHLENLIDRDGVMRAKTEMFEYANDNFDVILNGDDDKLSTIKSVDGRKVKYYSSISDEAYCYADNIQEKGIFGTDFTLNLCGEKKDVHINIPGVHMVGNAMAAATAGHLLGMNLNDIADGIEKLKNAAGRLNVIKKEYTVIDDCYNANPVSMKSSVDILAGTKGRTIAVTGDMFELGADEEKLHYEVGQYIADKHIDVLFTCGKLSKNVKDGYISVAGENADVHYFLEVPKLVEELKTFIKKGDVLLVKASHSMHFENIVKEICNEEN